MHIENKHEKTNKLEQIHITTAATSPSLLNDVINGKNGPLFKLLPQLTLEDLKNK